MRVKHLAECFTLAGFLVGGYMSSAHENEVRIVGVIVATASLGWYFWKGAKLKGWTGPTLDEINEDIKALHSAQIGDFSGKAAKYAGLDQHRLQDELFKLGETRRQYELEHKKY